jgi:hypothetical protein
MPCVTIFIEDNIDSILLYADIPEVLPNSTPKNDS